MIDFLDLLVAILTLLLSYQQGRSKKDKSK